VCRRTKQSHFIPCNETVDAAGTARLFIKNIFRLHGLPDDIVSDRGAIFTSSFWNALRKQLKVKLNRSTAFHPESDGQTERVNQTLEQYLRCYVDYQQDDWAELLPIAEFSYNNANHSSTNLSPFYANYGFNPRADFLALAGTGEASSTATTNIEKISLAQEYLQRNLERAREDAKRFADKNRIDNPFKVGDMVWLLRRNIKTKRPCDKLDHRRLGPFSIIEKINQVAFKLELPVHFRIHPVFQCSLLEKYVTSEIPGRINPPPPPVEIDGNVEYEVEDIVDAKYVGKTLKFLVCWKGYSAARNTWEPLECLENCPEILERFKARYPEKLLKTRGTRPGRRR
jgi:hypothetical protein